MPLLKEGLKIPLFSVPEVLPNWLAPKASSLSLQADMCLGMKVLPRGLITPGAAARSRKLLALGLALALKSGPKVTCCYWKDGVGAALAARLNIALGN